MSGRIADLAVYEANLAIYYVGTAHGGVWKTTSNGTTFIPQFQDQGLISIGDVTVSQTNPDLVWVGAGGPNNRQSTSWGGGVYKSRTAAPRTSSWDWRVEAHQSHHHRPEQQRRGARAATGLFGSGGERGSTRPPTAADLEAGPEVDDWTGANDLVMSATNPRILFASTYQRVRNACCMNGGGPGRHLEVDRWWRHLDRLSATDCPKDRPAASRSTSSGAAGTSYALIEGPATVVAAVAAAVVAGAPVAPRRQHRRRQVSGVPRTAG